MITVKRQVLLELVAPDQEMNVVLDAWKKLEFVWDSTSKEGLPPYVSFAIYPMTPQTQTWKSTPSGITMPSYLELRTSALEAGTSGRDD